METDKGTFQKVVKLTLWKIITLKVIFMKPGAE
jgi:hypothetical protein